MQKPLHPVEAAFSCTTIIWHGLAVVVNAWCVKDEKESLH
jgi:hypothetical protein